MTTYAGEDMEKGEHSFTAGGSANLYSYFGDQSVLWFLRKMAISLPQDLAITLLGIYPNDPHPCNKDMCSTMFSAALFVIARSWKQPRCPSTEEWIKKMCTSTQWNTTLHKKDNGILKFAGKWMELEETILNEVTQSQKEEQGMYSLMDFRPRAKDHQPIIHTARGTRIQGVF